MFVHSVPVHSVWRGRPDKAPPSLVAHDRASLNLAQSSYQFDFHPWLHLSTFADSRLNLLNPPSPMVYPYALAASSSLACPLVP